jgi:hypothetical protein
MCSIAVRMWHVLTRLCPPSLYILVQVCGCLTYDIKREGKKGREQHFPTAVLQSRIVTIRALFQYTSLWAACTTNTACSVAYTYSRTQPYNLRPRRERERERWASSSSNESSLDFVWILCVPPSTREGTTMKTTGLCRGSEQSHRPLNASTARSGTVLTEACSCL